MSIFSRSAKAPEPIESLTIRAHIESRGDVSDESLLEILESEREVLVRELQHLVAEALPTPVISMDVQVRRGSVEVLISLGVLYVGVSRYKAFAESVVLLSRQIGGLLARFLRRRFSSNQVWINVSWQPTSSPVVAEEATPAWPGGLVGYLMLSHAALLATVIVKLFIS
ncbi:MAG: hypothetical protein IH941_11570 [Acidobacteria bacterium]|nr:hypothetical protein [Acidobacteriota bacterium]